MSGFRLPNATQRLTINGRTGSGKTQFACWVLSRAPFDAMPYVIIDYKGDKLIADIEGKEEISLKTVPKKPGLYWLNPHPGQTDEVEAWLWKVWEAGKVGIYLDEGYMIPPRSKAFQAILTQGRALRIPAIVLSQRPSFVSRMVFSEADFYCCFALNDWRDMETVQQFTPVNEVWNFNRRLGKYYSRWYDVSADYSAIVAPAPPADEIIETFAKRLKPRRRVT